APSRRLPSNERLFDDHAWRLFGIELGLLRQIEHARAAPAFDDAGVRLLDSGEHAEQRALTGAVHAQEAHALAANERERNVREQRLGAVSLGEIPGAQNRHAVVTADSPRRSQPGGASKQKWRPGEGTRRARIVSLCSRLRGVPTRTG